MKDERTPPRVRGLLAEIAPIKGFGEENGLKPTKNYTEYVKLDRPAAVWVVSACEKLEFKSKEWSFPLVGRFPYLGWFDLEQARDFAAELRAGDRWDVDVRGASAYSTLGWFRDAVLSTMLPEGDEALGQLVNVVLHESVHATLYIKGQAYFNESVASFVADRLTEAYLDRRAGASPATAEELRAAPEALRISAYPERAPSKDRLAYLKDEAGDRKRLKRLHETYERLAALYASKKTDAEKLEEKASILRTVKEELGFKREINNATLIQFKAYNTGGIEFAALWKACGGDSRRFLDSLSALTPESFRKDQQEDLAPVLSPLAQAGCPAPKR